jgi:drug/metabolite transporter (DMT)-like permease
MLAVVLALIAAAGYGGSDYAAGLAARRASVVRVTVLSQVTSAVLVTCLVPFIGSRAPDLTSVLWGAGAGASGVAGAMALYLGFRHADFSVASSVSAVGTAAFAVLAGLALGERPAALSLVGICFALPAIVGVSAPAGRADPGPVKPPGPGQQAASGQPGPAGRTYADKGRGDRGGVASGGVASGGEARTGRHHWPGTTGRHTAGVGLGLAAGLGFGLFFVGLNRAGSGSDLWPIVVSQVAALVTVSGAAAATRQLGFPQAGARLFAVLTGAIGAAGTLFYFLATHRGLLAVTAVITSLYPAGTILLARVLSGERLTGLRIIGLCLAAASVALIAVGGAG